jgi:hypothetical protein
MTLSNFIAHVRSGNNVTFEQSLAIIADNYDYQATSFTNGIGQHQVNNVAGSNQGSCKIFAFAKLNNLDAQQTLTLFGEHYKSVVSTPNGNDHQNIRQFMSHGWQGIHFDNVALTTRTTPE